MGSLHPRDLRLHQLAHPWGNQSCRAILPAQPLLPAWYPRAHPVRHPGAGVQTPDQEAPAPAADAGDQGADEPVDIVEGAERYHRQVQA